MIDVGLCPADVLLQLTDLRRQLVASQLDNLCRLGYERDIELLFHEGYCMPDWDLASVLDTEARDIVREICELGTDIERARDELDFRSRPN
jgi:hypothetical protein